MKKRKPSYLGNSIHAEYDEELDELSLTYSPDFERPRTIVLNRKNLERLHEFTADSWEAVQARRIKPALDALNERIRKCLEVRRGLEPLMSTDEVAGVLRFSPEQLLRLIREGKVDLEPVRAGTPRHFAPADVRAYIERCKARGGRRGP